MASLTFAENAVNRLYRASQWVLPGGWAPPPLITIILLTYRCNLSCPFCYQKLAPMRDAGENIEPRIVERVLSQIPPRSVVVLSGGEPFAHPRAMDILELCAKKHPTIVVTNGTYLNEPTIEKLMKLSSKGMGRPGLMSLGLSLYESFDDRPLEDTIRLKKDLIRSLIEKRRIKKGNFPRLSLKITLRKDNIEQLDEIFSLLREGLGDEVVIQMMIDFPFDYTVADAEPGKEFFRTEKTQQDTTRFFIADENLLRRRIEQIRGTSEWRKGLIRFYPDLTTEEIVAHYTKGAPNGSYYCTLPWSALLINPKGQAFQCRSPYAADTADESIRKIWNGPEFRRFRREVLKTDLASHCAGCCFLKSK